MAASITPELLELLKSQSRETVNIFAKLKSVSGADKSAPAVDRSERAAAVVERVAKLITGTKPRFHYRDLDSVLQVNADPRFIQELLRQPEIAEASSVPDLGSAYIAPVGRREVAAKDISEPTFPRRHVSNKKP
jgi:hypothetical protein